MTKQSFVFRGLWAACALLAIGNVVWFAAYRSAASHERAAAHFPLLSSRVFADTPNDQIINFVPLRTNLQQTFNNLTVQHSFYFEYLPNGTSIRLGADNELIAASLIKVPLVMNLYRAAELGRINLDQTVTITPEELDNAYGNLWQKGAGFRLTLRQAAQYALEQSDNTATHVIFDHVRNLLAYDEQSLARLDINQNEQNGQAVIDARSYGSVLKGLYFSAYLQKQDSEEMLEDLTRSTATNRIIKQLPPSVKVAHKIGVFNTTWSQSDCGIVYAPKRPYLLCVMMGLPEDRADRFIAGISKQVYDFVVSQ